MTTLAEIRARLGRAADGYTDQDLFEVAKEAYGPLYSDPQKLQRDLGYDPNNNFRRGFGIAWKNTKAAVGGLGALGADAVGWEGGRDASLDYAREQRQLAFQAGRRSDDVDNFAEDPAAFLSAGAGQAAGYALPSLLGGGVGGLGARAVGMRAVTGALAGSYGVNYAQEAGSIYNELADQGRYEPGRAALYGGVAAALDTAPEVVGVGRLMKGGRGGLRGMASAAGKGAVTEAGTEMGQTAIERAGAYQPLDGPDAWHDYRNAAALGALGGGMFGGATGWRRSPSNAAAEIPLPELPQDPDTPHDLLMLGWNGRSAQPAPAARPGLGWNGQYGLGSPGTMYAGQGSDAQAFGNVEDVADSSQPYQYPDALPYEQVDVPMGPPQGGLSRTQIPPVGFDAPQGELFDREALYTPEAAPQATPEAAAAPADDSAPLFDNTPTSLVRTDFSADQVRRQILADTGRMDTFGVKLAKAVSDAIDDPVALTDRLDEMRDSLERSKLAVGTIKARVAAIDAAIKVVGTFQQRMLDAQVQEGVAKAQPGTVTNVADRRSTTAAELRAANQIRQQREAQQEAKFYEAVQAEENALRSTPNEMDPGLVREAKPGVESDGQRRLFPRQEMRVARAPAQGAAAPAAATASVPDGQMSLFDGDGKPTAPAPGTKALASLMQEVAAKSAPAEKPTGEKAERDVVTAGKGEIDSALAEYNSAPRDQSVLAKRRHEQKVRDAASFIYETMNDPGESEAVRNYARKIFHEEIDPGDVVASRKPAVDVGPDSNGRPEISGNGVYIGFGLPTERMEVIPAEGQEVMNFAIMPEGSFDAYGFVELLLEDGRPTSLLDIEVSKDARAKGVGRKAVEALLAAYPDADINISNIVPEARGFWEKMGVPVQNVQEGDAYDGTLNWETYAAANGRGADQDAGAGAGSRKGNPAGGTRGTAQAPAGTQGRQQGLTTQQVADALGDIVSSWENGPSGGVQIVQSTSDLPRAVQRALQSTDEAGNTRAFFATGQERVYMIADRLDSAEEAQQALFHEVYGHLGLRSVTGDAYARTMRQMQSINTGLAKEASDWMRDYGAAEIGARISDGMGRVEATSEVRLLAIEEALADRAAQNKPVRGLDRVMAALQRGLRRLGLDRVANWLEARSDAEVKSLLAEARNAVREGGPRTPSPTSGSRGMSSRKDSPAAFNLPEPAPAGRMQSALNTVRAAVSDWRNTPGVLGWLSLRQIGDRFNTSDRVRSFVEASLRMGQRREEVVGEAAQAVTPWRNMPADQQVALSKVMLEATMAQANVDKAWTHASNAHLRTEGDTNKADFDRVRALYEALPQRSKETYAKVRDTAQAQWGAMAEARLAEIKRAYKPELAAHFTDAQLDEVVKAPKRLKEALKSDAQYAPLPKSVKRALRSLIEAAEVQYEEAAQMKGPYFPLVRFGDHVVVAKSAPFSEAQAAYEASRDELQKLYDADPPAGEAEEAAFEQKIVDAKAAVQKARQAVELLKGSERHYAVTFFENRWEAEAYLKRLESDAAVKKFGLKLALEQRSRHMRTFDSASPQFVRKLEEQLRTVLPKSEAAAVQEAVREVYLRTLPDRSALKSELRRLNVAGAKSTEMMRGFVSRSMANAHRISRMEFGGQMQDALVALRDSDDLDERLVGDEFGQRMLKSLEPPKRNAVLERAAQLTHLAFLGASPSYVMMNAAQPWAISLPIMAARHGWAASGKALGDASVEVFKSIKALRAEEGKKLKDAGTPWATARSFRFNIQPEQLGRNDAERQMLRQLFNDGLINITIEHDLGAVASGADKKWIDYASEMASTPAHLVEIVNRVATALAAFRMEQRRDTGDVGYGRAVAYATQVVGDTHLDYGAENAPRLMRSDSLGGFGRIVWQFKKYMQGMIYLQAKLIKDALKGNTEALKGFAYLNGMTFGVAGAAGLPVAGGMGLLAKAFAQLWEDDDEPDFYMQFYNGLKDAVGETAARALMKGLPAAAGIDLSQRMGQANLTNPGQFIDWGKDGRDLYQNIVMTLLGPASALVANYFDAAQVAATDPTRALTLVMPKALADPIKAFDRADRGIVSRSGKELVATDELDAAQNLFKALGFESTQVADMYEARGAETAAKQRTQDVRKALLRRYAEAKEAGKPTGPIMDEIAGFNRRNAGAAIRPTTLRQATSQRNSERVERGEAKRRADVADQLGI